MNPSLKTNRVGHTIALLLLVGLLIVCVQQYGVWSQVTTASPEDVGKDYLGKVLGLFIADPIKLLFGETEGSAPLLKFFSIGLVWIWTSYALGRAWSKQRHVVDRLYWGSLVWCIWATVWVLFAWIWAAGVQHFGWYACYPQTIQGVLHQCYPGEQGTLDGTTHWFTPGALFSIIATVNIMDVLGLRGRIGRGLELGIKIAIMFLIIISFEIIESGNPAVYVNTFINSWTDILFGLASVGFNAGWYEVIVPYEELINEHRTSLAFSKEGPC
jgi:hypothetical protein